ncbi:MAG: PPC domain-containing protein, partial [Planctomycetes bacterium]|nr:PPC domain-containing protein [Planctomycetota bacterium]
IVRPSAAQTQQYLPCLEEVAMSRIENVLSLAFLGGLCLAMPAWAVAPSVSALSPTGYQRGTEVEVNFAGTRLGDTQELMFYSPGIRVIEINAEKDNVVKAKLAIDADCRMGIHAVRLRTATGLSNLRTFTVGALPEVAEAEPNNDFDAPQQVAMGSTISGVVQNEDVDYFVVEAKKGDRIAAELEGIRLGYTFFDPYLAILNQDRFELARSDDATLLRQDCVCSVIAPEDGRYILQVRESAYGGSGSCNYRLHVGNFPRPTAVYPAGGRPGETLKVRWIGDPTGDWEQEITLPSLPDPEYGLFASDEHGISPSPNVIRVIDLPNALEAEPNDAIQQATAATAPGALNGVIEKPGDLDFFKFTATKGQVFDIRVHARNPLRSPLDSVLVVTRSNGSAVGSNDDSGGPDSYLRFTAPEDGDFFVRIGDHLSGGGRGFVYRVEITPVQPALTMVVPERTRYVSTTLAVPKGNRMALMVNATRANWGGDLNVVFENLPAGLTAQAVPMAASQTSVPVLFTAASDAPLNATLAEVIGRAADASLNIEGRLDQRTMLVRGQNNRDVWGHNASRMAAAVTDAVPFELEIVQPKSPIVRSGSKSLRIVAKRQDGFNQPIAIRLLYNPPGIGSSGSISIAADKSEADIPLTANGNAAIGVWPIVVTGSATVGNGAVEIATQMAELEIADSYMSFGFEKSAGELGQKTELIVSVENKAEFEGEATVELLGLPANTSTEAEPKKVTSATEQLVFPIDIAQDAKPGTYKSLVCRAIVMKNGEPVTYTQGTGELRVDQPLPPKVATPAAKPATPQPQPQAEAPKRLSRLEQLRLQKLQEEQQPQEN